jgi:hypothetical protein
MRPDDTRLSHIKVWVDRLPEGLSVSEGFLKIPDNLGITAVGKIRIYPGDRLLFNEYHEHPMKAYCNPQNLLLLGTLLLWGTLPPYWVCYPKETLPIEDLLVEVKRGACAAGANLAVITFVGVRVDMQSEAKGAVGYLFKTTQNMVKPIERGPETTLTCESESRCASF